MNRITLIGNLTKDPELSNTSSGISVCRFTLAVARRFANADGTKTTDFINIVAWRELGENCNKYLKKGNKCAVSGYLQSRTYENKDGVKVLVWEVVADEVEFLTPKQATTNDTELEPVEVDDDDLPF